MACDAMEQFAAEVLYPLAHRADQEEKFPAELQQYSTDLGLNLYALPEALGGAASGKTLSAIS